MKCFEIDTSKDTNEVSYAINRKHEMFWNINPL